MVCFRPEDLSGNGFFQFYSHFIADNPGQFAGNGQLAVIGQIKGANQLGIGKKRLMGTGQHFEFQAFSRNIDHPITFAGALQNWTAIRFIGKAPVLPALRVYDGFLH